MRYVKARLKKNDEDEAYRIYVTDLLKIISGKNELPRFYDIIHSDNKPTETPEVIISRIKTGVNSMRGGS